MLRIPAALALALLMAASAPAQAQQQRMLDQAVSSALAAFERAAPQMGAMTLGVDNAAYGDALRQRRFHSKSAGGPVNLHFVIEDSEEGSCARFAAYVVPVANSSDGHIFLCPKFFTPGADQLRQTTILHELVHVLMGPDECRAMAYTAQVQLLANGSFVPVAAYWDNNGCAASRYTLPG